MNQIRKPRPVVRITEMNWGPPASHLNKSAPKTHNGQGGARRNRSKKRNNKRNQTKKN